MKLTKWTFTALFAAAALGLGACDDKAPAPASGTSGTSGTGGTKLADATKGATDAAKDALNKGADTAKDAAKDAVNKAAAAVSDEAKKQFKDYTDELAKTDTTLEKIATPADATKSLGDLAASATKVSGFQAALSKLPADVQTALKNENKATLEPLVKKFKDQVARITGNADLNKILGDTLKNFKLFE